MGLKLFPNLKLDFQKPLLNISKNNIIETFRKEYSILNIKKIVAFHVGFGGSSDGNLSLDDYIKLAKKASEFKNIQVVFTFGPDDLKLKDEIKNKVEFNAIFYESKTSIIDFCKLLAGFELFISTSTGPMHLAGAVNIKTISFFGDSAFASAKRWATVSEEINQNNYSIPINYTKEVFYKVEERLNTLVNEIL